MKKTLMMSLAVMTTVLMTGCANMQQMGLFANLLINSFVIVELSIEWSNSIILLIIFLKFIRLLKEGIILEKFSKNLYTKKILTLWKKKNKLKALGV